MAFVLLSWFIFIIIFFFLEKGLPSYSDLIREKLVSFFFGKLALSMYFVERDASAA
jgi:hypothetical protein